MTIIYIIEICLLGALAIEVHDIYRTRVLMDRHVNIVMRVLR